MCFFTVSTVPLEIPQHFRVDASKPVTDRTADFLWNAVNTGPWRMQGFFRGYKVSFEYFLQSYNL